MSTVSNINLNDRDNFTSISQKDSSANNNTSLKFTSMALQNPFKKSFKKQQVAAQVPSSESTEHKEIDAFKLAPNEDDFNFVELDDDMEWTDEQLMDDSRPGRRRQAELSEKGK